MTEAPIRRARSRRRFTRRCSSADSRRRHPFVFVRFVVVRLSPVPAGIARQGIAGLSRSRLPLGRAGTVAGTNQTDNTNTNGYPYPSCVPIVDSEEPVFRATASGGRSDPRLFL